MAPILAGFTLCASLVFAQPIDEPPDPDLGTLVSLRSVREVLGLSEVQAAALNKVIEKWQNSGANYVAARRDCAATLNETLQPQQRKKLRQVAEQVSAADKTLDPAIQQTLRITADQLRALEEAKRKNTAQAAVLADRLKRLRFRSPEALAAFQERFATAARVRLWSVLQEPQRELLPTLGE